MLEEPLVFTAAQTSSFLIHSIFLNTISQATFGTLPLTVQHLCLLTGRHVTPSIDHQLLPTQPLPTEAEDLPSGGEYPQDVSLPITCNQFNQLFWNSTRSSKQFRAVRNNSCLKSSRHPNQQPFQIFIKITPSRKTLHKTFNKTTLSKNTSSKYIFKKCIFKIAPKEISYTCPTEPKCLERPDIFHKFFCGFSLLF